MARNSNITVDDLFSAVGYGTLPAAEVVRRLRPEAAPPREPPPKPVIFFSPEAMLISTITAFSVSAEGMLTSAAVFAATVILIKEEPAPMKWDIGLIYFTFGAMMAGYA